MVTLGITGTAHDPAAAIVVDGELIAAIEEERITRRKYEWKFPTFAINEVLRISAVGVDRVDKIGFYWDDLGQLPRSIAEELMNCCNRNIPTGSRIWKRLGASATRGKIARMTRAAFGPAVTAELRFFDHHLCHASYAYTASGFREAVVLVADGRGECATTSTYLCHGDRMSLKERIFMPHSLGFIYGAITQHLGFRPTEDEYRVMGLAAFGRPNRELDSFFQRLLIITPKAFQVNLELTRYQYDERCNAPWLNPMAWDELGHPRREGEALVERHANIAFALQRRYEEVMVHLVRKALYCHRATNLVLCGGVAMNSVANGKLVSAIGPEHFYTPPAPGDQGCAIGAALLASDYGRRAPAKPISFSSPYLGPEFDDEAIMKALRSVQLRYRFEADIASAAAELIVNGKICGWFQGRMEFGPRALGNRSILADVRCAEMPARINSIIKFRESFRPFAAAILQQFIPDYFEDGNCPSPYMNVVRRVKETKRNQLAAVTHCDGSCRLQSVDPEERTIFARLLEELGRRTGVPAVLNTSFNIKGEPIVMTPEDAIRRWQASELNALIIGNYVVELRSTKAR